MNDHYNAGVFVSLFKEKIRWCRDLGGWFIYNGKYWEKDCNGYIKHYAIETYNHLLKELQTFPSVTDEDKKRQELFARHVKATGNDGKLESLLECAKPFVSERPEAFDANPALFNCKNKTIDLDNLKAREFNQLDMITKVNGAEFIRDAKCPTWDKFIHDIFLGREDLIDFVQRSIGYSLSTSTKEQCLFIMYGHGRNGKTVFIETIRQLFGDYASNCAATTLIRKQNDNSIPNDIAALKGARFVTAVENNENVTLDEQVVKKITGTDTIRARFLNKEWFDFIPSFKIFMATNHKPNIRGTDVGIWRRIRMIPFDFKVTEETDNRMLGIKLKEELPGILLWAIEGYKKWRESGLTPPEEVKQATLGYQTEEDDLGQFIQDYCMPSENGEGIPVARFKARFKEVFGYHKGQKVIAEYMMRRGFAQERPYIDGTRQRCWMGLRLLTNWET